MPQIPRFPFHSLSWGILGAPILVLSPELPLPQLPLLSLFGDITATWAPARRRCRSPCSSLWSWM